jgi:cyclopropane-fatty-acyl-phospholipid synthase
MAKRTPETTIKELLALAGITVNGVQPWDIQVHDRRLYRRVIAQGSLGLGEAYVDGWWDVERLDIFICKVLRADLVSKVKPGWGYLWLWAKSKLFNMQSRKRAEADVRSHYDIDIDLYLSFLDPYMQYSCGYFKNTNDLAQGQEQKMELICQKLQLGSNHSVLDIGCGWGGFAKYAATKYGCSITGITVSESQYAYAKKFCAGLPVNILQQDYRDLQGRYDRIVSVGMFEHVGYKNYRKFMEVASRCLKPDGLLLLHTIGGNKSVHSTDAWLEKYIFPGSVLPSVKQVGKSIDNLFVLEDWHSFGVYYAETLRAWWENFDAAWDDLQDRYDERFYRMWKYYFLMCAGTFDARFNQLWQIVLTPEGLEGGYKSVR